MFSDDTIFVLVSGPRSSEPGDEVAILNADMSEDCGTNPVASWIWTRLQEPVSFGGLRRGIEDAFDDLAPSQLETLKNLIRSL